MVAAKQDEEKWRRPELELQTSSKAYVVANDTALPRRILQLTATLINNTEKLKPCGLMVRAFKNTETVSSDSYPPPIDGLISSSSIRGRGS